MSSWQEYKKKYGISNRVNESDYSQNSMSSWQEYKNRYSGSNQVEENSSSQNTMSSWQRYKKEQEERKRQEALKKAEEEERKRQEAIKVAEEKQKKQEEQTQKGQVQEFGNDINKNIIYGPSTVSSKSKFEERKNGSSLNDNQDKSSLPKKEYNEPFTNVKNTSDISLEAIKINEDMKKGNYGSAIKHIISGIPAGVVSGVGDIGNAGLTLEALNLSKGNKYLNGFIDKMSNAYKAMGKESEEEKNISLNVLKRLRDFSGNASNKLLDTAETISDKTGEYQRTNSQIDNKYIQTAGSVSNSIGHMLPSVASNVVLPGSGVVVTGVQSMGGSTMETLDEDRSNLDKAVLTGVAKGTTTATVEKVTGGNLVTEGGFDKHMAYFLKDKVKNRVAQKLLFKGYQIGGEVLEEQIENEVGYVIDKVINDEDMPDLKQRWGEAGETAKVTALTTVALNLMGLGGGSIDNVDISSLSNKDLKTVNDVVNVADYMNSARKYNIDTNDEAIKGIASVTSDRGIRTTYNADMFSDNSQNAIWRVSKDESGNTVREVILNPNATDTNKTLQNIIVHELTHDMEGTKQYNDLKNIVLKYDEGKVGYDEARKSLVDMYSKVYDVNGNDFNTLVDNEAVADILGSKLGDQDFINTLTTENRSVGRKIYDWVIDKLNKLNSMIGYKSEKLYWSDVKNKFENAFKQEYNAQNSNTRYSIEINDKGQKYVKADRQVISGKNPLEWEHQVENYINETIRNGKDVQVVSSDGDILSITENTSGKAKFRNEIIDKNGTKRRLNNKEFLSKLGAETHVDELAEVSKKINKKPIPDYKNHKFAKDGFDYRKAYFEDFDGQYYEITMSVGKNGNINTIYNIGKMDKKNRSKSSLVAQRPSDKNITSNEELTSINRIAPLSKDVNTTNTYSMQKAQNNTLHKNNIKKTSISGTSPNNRTDLKKIGSNLLPVVSNSQKSSTMNGSSNSLPINRITSLSKDVNINENNLTKGNGIDNANKTLYNGLESDGDINGFAKRFDNEKSWLYEKKKSNENRGYDWKEYSKWEKSIKPITREGLTDTERRLIDNAKVQYNKDVFIFDENSNDNRYSAGASYTTDGKIMISRQQAETFGLDKMICHETVESDILFNDFAVDILEPTIDLIKTDKNFELQKKRFWEGQEGNLPSDELIAKDILCDRFSEIRTGESLDYENVLSIACNFTIDEALNNYYDKVYGKQLDLQKNRTMNWLNGLGLQLPVPNNTSSSNNRIAPLPNDVNTNKNSNIRYSISGRAGMNNAIKNDTSNIELERLYNKANKMQKAGFDNEQIRQQTNWFQDRNGDWKFEFSDKDMSLKNNIKLEENKTYKLGDILEHDTLFLLYPELRNYTVEFKNINANGSFYRDINAIKINSKNINSNSKIEGTLIHEIQHAIQNIENFEKGNDLSRGKFNYYNSLGEIEATDTKSRFIAEKYEGKNLKDIAPVSSKPNPKHKDFDYYMKNRKLLDKLKDIRYNNKKRKGDNHGRSLEKDTSENKGRNNIFVGNNLFDSESINRIDNENVKKSGRLYIRENGKTRYQKTGKKNKKIWRGNVWNGLIDNNKKRKGDSHDRSLERDTSENKGRDNIFVGNNIFDSKNSNRINNENVKESERFYRNDNNQLIPIYKKDNDKTIFQNRQKVNGNKSIEKDVRESKRQNNRVVDDYRRSLDTKNSNMSSFSMQEIEGNAWQNRLDTLYKNNNKGTTIKDVKYPIQKFLDNRKVNYELDENGNIVNIEDPKQIDEFYNRDLKLDKELSRQQRQIKEHFKKQYDKDIAFFDGTNNEKTNLERYNDFKKNIIKGKETTVNSLISYKNESIRSLDNKILEKEALLNSKDNQSENSRAILRSQIEGLKAQRTDLQNSYNEKIDRASSKLDRDKIELETRSMMKKVARDSLRAEIAPLTNDLTKYKDKKAGILFNRETAQRNIDDIVSDSDLASAIKETVFDPVQVHQAEKTRNINSLYEKINSLGLDKTKKYSYLPNKEIVPVKVDEATLSQLIIEKKITDKDLRNYGFDEAGVKKIHRAADTFTEILDSLYNRMNEEQIKYGYSPIGRIENYFPHFLENRPDTMLGKVASYFGIDLTDRRLPTEIAGRTDIFKPGKTWNSNIQKRRTIKTDYDALAAMERYIEGASEIIYTTEDIQRVREYGKQIRYKFSDKGIQSEIDSIMNSSELTQEAKDLALDGIFKNTENELSNFVTWLDDYANTLAGKKSFADRNMERNIGRNIYSSMSGIESRIAANTIGGNLSVSLTNFAPIAQAAGSTKWSYLITGMMQTTSNNIKGMVRGSKDSSFVDNSNFLTNRFGTDSISQKRVTQKMSDFVSIPMNAIDEFTAESIVRAKFLENIDKGMSEEIALDLADKYGARIMADRSKGALPIVFNTKNPVSKLITMFQVEPNNIVSNYFKDMPRDAKSKVELTKQATKLMVASYAFNSLIMSVRSGNEVLPDPIRWVSYLVQAITGDEEERKKAKTDLSESILGNVPFLSNLAGLAGFEDIGRVPISNAMPNVSNLTKLADGEANGKYKMELAVKEFSKPFLYLGLPVGGAQIKKTVEGIQTVSRGGSYKTNMKGEKELQFAVENPNVANYIRAGVFGKYSLPVSKVYADRGYKALSAKQTKTLSESNIPYKEYIEYLDQKLTKKEDKINYLSSQNWGTNEKWGIYKNEILSDTKRKDDGGSQRLDAEYMISNGVSKSEFISLFDEAERNDIEFPTKEEYKRMRNSGLGLKEYIDFSKNVKSVTKSKRDSGELSGSQGLKDRDKIQILLSSDYTDEQKSAIYENYILTKNNSTYPLVKATGIDINEYMGYVMQEFDPDKVDDGTVNGKSISGSSKKKVYEYVNDMDISYEQRLMLLGMRYTLSDSEQTDLYNYVKSLDYSEDELISVFRKLKGFTVYNDGRVTW